MTTFPSTKTDILIPPWDITKSPAIKYEPIDCDFTDELEYVAVKKIAVQIQYWKQNSQVESVGLIKDIETANQEEHLIMSNGDRIRLDYIIQLKIKN